MDEGESPVGLAHLLARCTEGNSKKLVSARQTHFDGLGFFGLGFRRGGVLRGFDAVGLCEDGEGVGRWGSVEQSVEPQVPFYTSFFRGLGDGLRIDGASIQLPKNSKWSELCFSAVLGSGASEVRFERTNAELALQKTTVRWV